MWPFKAKKKNRHFILGRGTTLLATTTFDGMPGIVLCESPVIYKPAPKIGTETPEHEDYMREHGIIISFPNQEGLANFMEKMTAINKKFREDSLR